MKTKEDYVLWLKLSQKYEIYGLQKTFVLWRKIRVTYLISFKKLKMHIHCLFKISKV